MSVLYGNVYINPENWKLLKVIVNDSSWWNEINYIVRYFEAYVILISICCHILRSHVL